MHNQYVLGLHRLGHDVSYLETTTAWPYHPRKLTTTDDPSYALEYLNRVLTGFGMGDRWAYRAAYADGAWYGPLGSQALDLLRSADAVFNITGSTTPEEIGVPCRLIYIGTDPVLQEIRIANGDQVLRDRVAAHQAHFSYGENIGRSGCPVPPLPFPTRPIRQPIVLPLWDTATTPNPVFTTVTNWEVTGYDAAYQGEVYTWSKHRALEEFLELPRHTQVLLELALGLSGRSDQVIAMLEQNGWRTTDAYEMSLDVWPYRDYIRSSAGELSVAKDMVVRTRCGWFSERSACYLAAGRPVVTQDTGFGRVLPTGKGLFAFRTIEEAVQALDAIQSDYALHSRAARAIAEEYFQAEKVLGGILAAIGL